MTKNNTKLPSGFIVTSNGTPCRLDGRNFTPAVLMPCMNVSGIDHDEQATPRRFSRTREAETAMRHTCHAQYKLKDSLASELPVVKRLMQVGNFRVVSLREQAKREMAPVE